MTILLRCPECQRLTFDKHQAHCTSCGWFYDRDGEPGGLDWI